MALVLGTFAFLEFEIPASIPFGGRQMLKAHRYMGGKRVIDAMGPDDRPIEWSGQFRGFTASLRARQLDLMRRAGRALILTWDTFSYRVVIETFEADYQASFEIPYRISCVVVSDLVAEIAGPALERLEDAVSGALTDALGAAGLDSYLGPVVTGVQTSVQALVTGGRLDFQAVGASAMAGVQATAGNAVTLVGDHSAGLDDVLGGGLSSIQPGADPSAMAGNLTSIASAADGAYRSQAVGALLTTIRANVGRVGL